MNKNFKIIFSRHAKRRLKLYGLNDQFIIEKIKFSFSNQVTPLKNAKMAHEFPDRNKKSKFRIKVVLIVKHYDIIVVTVYPIKKRK